ncbi:MAG: tRNA uridine-5-carboxymethylaminomethyl(34) synthesis GTPase MnmE [Deltaproteobacteria bacterium]|nr:tRNA uridine-5-carboxymethylaminomethyl(34) synthesis GTPase MnmE [Deltaproteobacteria bacterium]
MDGRDTIAALATATGPGAVTILRLSGPGAFSILARLCPGPSPAPRELVLRPVIDPATGELIDRALVVRFPAPASFTGEDVAEIQAHGGALLADALLSAALAAGARAARPGEFSRRAFEGGRLDLAQAEGLAELISAGSEAGLRAARALFGGELSREVGALLERLEGLQARLEALIDFPEQSGALDEEALARDLAALRARLGALHRSHAEGRRRREGARVLLVGAPNVGKSSLFNALVGHARAIVHAEPGTTRDAVEGRLELHGLGVTLVDSAGVREAPGEVEAEGVERTRRALEAADLILWVQDLGEEAPADPATAQLLGQVGEGQRILPVGNKRDRAGEGASHPLPVSALTGEGLGALREALAGALGAAGEGSGGEAGVVLTLARHEAAAGIALEALEQAEALRAAGGGLDALSEELGEARRQLAGILGRIALPEALLDRIFGDFCLGK